MIRSLLSENPPPPFLIKWSAPVYSSSAYFTILPCSSWGGAIIFKGGGSRFSSESGALFYERGAAQFLFICMQLNWSNILVLPLMLVYYWFLISEGLIGMAIIGGAAAVAVGGIVTLGVALAKKSK